MMRKKTGVSSESLRKIYCLKPSNSGEERRPAKEKILRVHTKGIGAKESEASLLAFFSARNFSFVTLQAIRTAGTG